MTGAVDLGVTVGACAVDRSVLSVDGPDAEEFLQGQLSQDIAALSVGRSAWSLILQPQGRVDAFVRVTRTASDRFILDTDGPADPVAARLKRFMLRTDVAVEPLDWRCIAVRGPGAGDVAVSGEVIGPVPTGGIDVLGPDPHVPPDILLVEPEVLEVHRIRAGFPKMGVDIDERTIPAEAEVVPWTVSFTKGCYTGQELVARMDSRDSRAPRYLRLVTVPGRVPLAGGEAIATLDGAEVGAVTSAAWDAATGSTVALGYVRRSVEVPAVVQVSGTEAHTVAVHR